MIFTHLRKIFAVKYTNRYYYYYYYYFVEIDIINLVIYFGAIKNQCKE